MDSSPPTMRPAPSALSSALLVGLDAGVADACERFVNPYPVLRVAHAAAAVARICIIHPKVVVITSDLREVEARDVREAAAILGADVIIAHADRGADVLPLLLAALEKG
jgi:hypothetical protein